MSHCGCHVGIRMHDITVTPASVTVVILASVLSLQNPFQTPHIFPKKLHASQYLEPC